MITQQAARLLVVVVCLSIGPVVWATSRAAPSQPPETGRLPLSEYHLKAALLYHFAKFTECPASAFPEPAAPLHLCVLGDNPFGTTLRAFHGRTVNVRPLATRHVRDVRDLSGCHVVFVSATGSKRPFQDLNQVESQPLLTVGDAPGFAQAGGMIGLKIIEDRIRFEINVTSARRKSLWFDARLLRLADIVYIENAKSR